MQVAKKFHRGESAFVYIKMNVSFLEVGRNNFPNLCSGVHLFYRFPCAAAKPFAVKIRIEVEEPERIFPCRIVYMQCRPANFNSVGANPIDDGIGGADHFVNFFIFHDIPRPGPSKLIYDRNGKHIFTSLRKSPKSCSVILCNKIFMVLSLQCFTLRLHKGVESPSLYW